MDQLSCSIKFLKFPKCCPGMFRTLRMFYSQLTRMPYAQCYGGHQFGMWAGQLGDDRAITIGEILNSKSQRWELQLKGAGKTPYSLFADGLAVLRSSIREFLCNEAIHSLGIPTTRALCLVTTGKYVTRDMFYDGNPKDEPGAIVCGVAQSFIRFGSYQIHASRGTEDLGIVRTLAYAIRHHFPHLENLSKSDSLSFSTGEGDDSVVDLTSNKYAAWSVKVAERTAVLVAKWQGVGFTHGVLNTDNMSVLGLTIDYGPLGFLDAFDPSFTPNTTDLPGRRYCFANQPDISLWNITQFATTLSAAQLISEKESNYAMERYGTKFMDEYQTIMTKKLSLPKYSKQLIGELLKNMAVDKVDYTNFFRLLSNIKADPTIPEDELLIPLKAVLLDIGKERKDAWTSWVKSYIQENLRSGGTTGEMRSRGDFWRLNRYVAVAALRKLHSHGFNRRMYVCAPPIHNRNQLFGRQTLHRHPYSVSTAAGTAESQPRLFVDLINIMEQKLSAIESRHAHLQAIMNQAIATCRMPRRKSMPRRTKS